MTHSRNNTPNVLIAGVQKGGTTWLHQILSKHRHVFMSVIKELNYFNRPDRVRSSDAWAKYLENFSAGTDAQYKYRGESTPHYLWVKDAASRYSPSSTEHNTAETILSRLGSSVQVIVILRHPTERAISAAHHHHSSGRLGTAEEIWDAPPKLGIIDLGCYKRHLSTWLDVFGNKNLHIFLYDDLVRHPRTFVRQVTRQLELPCEESWLDNLPLYTSVNSREQLRLRIGRHSKAYEGIKRVDVERLNELFATDILYVRSIMGDHVWVES